METNFFIGFWPPRSLWAVITPPLDPDPAALSQGTFNMLFTNLLLTGTHAARPSAATLGDGILYAETDTGVIFQVQSGAWVSWLPAPAGSGTVTNVATGTGLTGGPITATGTIELDDTAVTPDTYGDSTHVGVFTVDAQGRITAASEAAISGGGGGSPGGSDKNVQYNNSGAFGGIANNTTGTVKYLAQVSSGTPGYLQIDGADLVSASVGPTQLAATAVTPGTYGDSTHASQVTVDADGRITAAADIAIAGGGDLQLIETIDVSSTTTEVTFSGLDGDADGRYRLVGQVKAVTSDSGFDVKPNSSTASLNGWIWRVNPGGQASNTSSLWVINGDPVKAGKWGMFQLEIQAARTIGGAAVLRTYEGKSINYLTGGGLENVLFGGEWTNTADNLTSIGVRCNSGSNLMAAGTRLSLYKYIN